MECVTILLKINICTNPIKAIMIRPCYLRMSHGDFLVTWQRLGHMATFGSHGDVWVTLDFGCMVTFWPHDKALSHCDILVT